MAIRANSGQRRSSVLVTIVVFLASASACVVPRDTPLDSSADAPTEVALEGPQAFDAPDSSAADAPATDRETTDAPSTSTGDAAIDISDVPVDATVDTAMDAPACQGGYRTCPGSTACIRTAPAACCADKECPSAKPSCVDNVCKARALNDSCSADTECGSGHCAPTASGATTKVCCSTACDGPCNASCAGGTCEHKPFRTSCGEIDNNDYAPRFYLCDGNGNCNPPVFPCGTGSSCAAKSDVACCGDPNNNLRPACLPPATCAQGAGNFAQNCRATIDCPVGNFCCVIQNLDVQLTACSANCQTYAPAEWDSTAYAHGQSCDYLRDSSCPAGQHCGVANDYTGISLCE